jgi:uncharacterized membrane protein YheB (UPF0754 family)
MGLQIIVMVLIGAMIGWMTNVVAIKLLFRPIKPIKLFLLPITIQGLMPKRQKDIAKSIGETVENELLNSEDILKQLFEKTDRAQIIEKMGDKIHKIAENKMPAMIPGPFKQMALQHIDKLIVDEGDNIIDSLEKEVSNHVENELDISHIVEEKINIFPFEQLEKIIIGLAKQELKHIEALGGVIGAIIGLFQGIIVQIL